MADHTLTQNTATAVAALNDVRAALIEADVDMTNVPASDYGDTIRENCGGAQPSLYAPSLSRTNNMIYISNPSSNGSFVNSYSVYNGDALLKTQTGTSIDLLSLGAGEYQLSVAATGQRFIDSAKSNVIKADVYRITKSLQNLTANNSTTLISNGMQYTVTLTPTSGYYLPEDIVVTMGGKAASYEYDSYTGVITIKSVTGDIDITAVAYNAPKLRRPTAAIKNSVLTITSPRYAERTETYIDGTLTFTDTEA